MLTTQQACPLIILSLFEAAKLVDEKQVKIKLVDISIAQQDDHMFEFKYEVTRGSISGQFIFDYVHFIPFQSTSWKMPKILRALGYTSGPINFLIYIGTEITVDLLVGTSKTDGRMYQNIVYFDYGKYVPIGNEVLKTPVSKKVNEVGKPLPTTPLPLFEMPSNDVVKDKPIQPIKKVEEVKPVQPEQRKVEVFTDVVTGEVIEFDPDNGVDEDKLPF